MARDGANTQRRRRNTASTSAAAPPPAPDAPAPWLHVRGTPFEGDRIPLVPDMTARALQSDLHYRMRQYGEVWDRFNSLFYNGFLRAPIVASKFICEDTLQRMGIRSEVRDMLTRMGFGTMAYRTYPLYPELVRQFLSSCELKFAEPAFPNAQEGVLGFLCNGLLYEISIPELCSLYGFDAAPELCKFREHSTRELWTLIGSKGHLSRQAKLSLIRNPVLRVVSKVLGHSLFGKEETGSLRADELLLLHYGLPDFIQGIYENPPPLELGTNLGAIFAYHLTQRKFRVLRNQATKTERLGSFLTPIFEHCGVNLASSDCVTTRDFYSEQFFRNSDIICSGFRYIFQFEDGVSHTIQLPCPDLTSLTSIANVAFRPSQDLWCDHVPGVAAELPRRRSTSARPSTSQPPPPTATFVSAQHPDGEYILPPYAGEFDLPDLAPDASERERQDFIIDGIRKNNSMMQRILGALSRIRCPAPPSCFRGESSRARHASSRSPPSAEDATHSDGHLHRRRRQVSDTESDSESPEF